jgi:hypothetical protein
MAPPATMAARALSRLIGDRWPGGWASEVEYGSSRTSALAATVDTG